MSALNFTYFIGLNFNFPFGKKFLILERVIKNAPVFCGALMKGAQHLGALALNLLSEAQLFRANGAPIFASLLL